MKNRFNKKLLVEGNDDQHVIWSICQKYSINQNFEVIDCKGIDNLLSQISVRLKESEIDTLGIIVDADTEIKTRWQSLSKILTLSGFVCPEHIPNEGLIIKKQNITIGVWIMPDNNLNGMLEDFISFLVPPKDELLIIADETLATIEEKNINKYGLIHKSKAKIHSWLSWQEDPGTPMGLAITKKYLTTEGEQCTRFITWLTQTFR